jgi:nitrite reductase/ring-hydroxylating ferredoxin subunit
VVAIFRLGAGAVVTDDACTHNGAPLTEYGDIVGDVLECIWHGCQFDLKSGQALDGPCEVSLRIHACSIRDGKVVASD